MTRRKLIAGNWKMNTHRGEADALMSELLQRQAQSPAACDLLICPPASLLERVGQWIAGSGLFLGAQDCHPEAKGAFTGDIAASMIHDLGGHYVIVGHSERRAAYGESNDKVRSKAAAAAAAGLTAIVCVGENEQERLSGRALDVVGSQLAGSLPTDVDPDRLVVAYEPVWAIGSGRTPSLADVQEVHGDLRRRLTRLYGDKASAVRILYGGSVKSANAAELLTLPDVDGGLIGGASLNAEAFWTIALLAAQGGAGPAYGAGFAPVRLAMAAPPMINRADSNITGLAGALPHSTSSTVDSSGAK